MPFFADAAVQSTKGTRGRTTRRRSTKTVCGPDGAYAAMVKEELRTRPAGWLVRYETVYDARPRLGETAPTVKVSTYGRFDTEGQAEACAAGIPTGEASRFKNHNFSGHKSRVWVEREVK